MADATPSPDAPAGGGGLANDLLGGGGQAQDAVKALVLAKLLKAALDKQQTSSDPFKTQLDPFYGSQAGGAFRNPEYAPSSTGIKHLFLGGSPYPVPPAQNRAASNYRNMAAVSNILDAVGGVQRQQQPQPDLMSLLGGGQQVQQPAGGGLIALLHALGMGGGGPTQ